MPQLYAKIRVIVLMGNIDAPGMGDGVIVVDAFRFKSEDIAGGRVA